MTSDLIKLAYNRCDENRALLFKSDKCGCYHCGEFFSPFEIDSWGCYNDGSDEEFDEHPLDTAECPKCQRESVIPYSREYKLTIEFLAQVNHYCKQKQRSNPFLCRENAWFVHGVTTESWAKRWDIEPFSQPCKCGKLFVTTRPFVAGNLRGLMAEECENGCDRNPPYAVVAIPGHNVLGGD